MSEPIQICLICDTYVVVKPDGRGFPPKIAERKLRKICKANGCSCYPEYRAGIDPQLLKRPDGAS